MASVAVVISLVELRSALAFEGIFTMLWHRNWSSHIVHRECCFENILSDASDCIIRTNLRISWIRNAPRCWWWRNIGLLWNYKAYLRLAEDEEDGIPWKSGRDTVNPASAIHERMLGWQGRRILIFYQWRMSVWFNRAFVLMLFPWCANITRIHESVIFNELPWWTSVGTHETFEHELEL